MEVKIIPSQEFEKLENNFATSNFLQTAAMSFVQSKNPRFVKVETVGVYQEGQVVSMVVLVYRKRFKVFTEALALHGPLFRKSASTKEKLIIIDCLEGYLKKSGVAHFDLYPYLLNETKSATLKPIESGLEEDFKQALLKMGYTYGFDKSQGTIVNTMFVKNLNPFDSVEEIYNDFSNSLKRDLKKFTSSQVKVEELERNQLSDFYDILLDTGKRKGFDVQPLSYFENLKDDFGPRAQFMLAFLDVPAYREYLSSNISDFEHRIHELETGPQKKRTKGQIADAKDQLQSYYKRQKQLEDMQLESNRLPLSAYLFMSNDREMVSFSGGNNEDYMNFGGATVLHWEMIQKAFENGQEQFNFYGTIETEAAGQGQGNFNFKRQFGGELDILLGQFSKSLHPLYSLLTKLKKD